MNIFVPPLMRKLKRNPTTKFTIPIVGSIIFSADYPWLIAMIKLRAFGIVTRLVARAAFVLLTIAMDIS